MLLVNENGSGTVSARCSSVWRPVIRCSQMSVSEISPVNHVSSRIAANASSAGFTHVGSGCGATGFGLPAMDLFISLRPVGSLLRHVQTRVKEAAQRAGATRSIGFVLEMIVALRLQTVEDLRRRQRVDS